MTNGPSPGDVSVVIPAYNAAWCIDRALQSVLRQTRAPREIIVVNDGSTDETAAKVSEYRGRVTLLNKENGGLSSARNAGIRAARTEWVAFLDADDYWLPGKLEAQLDETAANPNLGFCSTRTLVENEQGATIGSWDCPTIRTSVLHTLFAQNAAIAGSGSSVMARRRLLLELGLFDESLSSLEDIDMWMRLAAVTEYRCIDEPLTVIVKHPDSMSRNLEVMRAAALGVMVKNRNLLPPHQRGALWQAAYAGVLADYAKWEYRAGHRARAMRHLLEGLVRAPLRRGRLLTSLLLAMARGQSL